MCRSINFNIFKVVGGVIAGSLAILSDAAHLSSDLAGFFISVFAIWIGQKRATNKLSYGYSRAEVIGALGSIVLIWALTLILFYEATMRIIEKSVVDDPFIMLCTSGFGLFCNLVIAVILYSPISKPDEVS